MSNSYSITVNSKRKNINEVFTFSTTYAISHINNIVWSLGDGTTATTPTIKHSYSTAGKKKICCIINKRYKLNIKVTVIDNSPPPPPPEEVEDGINLRVINQSNSVNPLDILIFQKNSAGVFDETAIAWKVIQNLSQNDSDDVLYAYNLTLSAQDTYGNFSPSFVAQIGQNYTATNTISGFALISTGDASSPNEIQVTNDLESTINALLFRTGLLTAKLAILSNQSSSFQFRPTIWIGIVSGVTQGDTIDSTIISSINTEISLLGIKSADIIVTGGGAGPSATPFSFSLSNIVFA